MLRHGSDETRRPALIPHPLYSTELPSLLKLFRTYGGPGPRFRYWRRAICLILASAIRTPLHRLERFRVRKTVAAQEFPPSTVFIIGHWRSGTTLLHELLAQDPQLARVTLLQAAFPLDFLTTAARPMLKRIIPRQRPMDGMKVHLDSPWEEEMAMACFGSLSYFHTFFFPRQTRNVYRRSVHFDGLTERQIDSWWSDYRYFLQKVLSREPGLPLLLKNPANTARISALRAQFPSAKFIHVHRNPYEVFASTLFMHQTLQKFWALQDSVEEELEEALLKNHADLLNACFQQSRGLCPNEYVEIAFDDLKSAPIPLLQSIYDSLGLQGFEQALPRFKHYLETVSGHRQNALSLNQRQRAAIKSTLADAFDRWHYRR